jgi:hypothetical protein
MSDLESIQNVLARAASRRRSQRAWNGFWQGLLIGAVVWLAALATYKLAPIPFSILLGAGLFAALCAVGGFLRGWLHKSTLLETARCVDERQQLQQRMSTALEMAGAGGDETWRTLLMADAARFAASIDPRKMFPFHLTPTTRWALVVLALGAGLGFVPEYRTSDYRAKQEDAAAVKDVGKHLVEITHRTLEQRPPVLETTHKAVESVGELGLKLDRNALTRNDALKDLANVADKLKSQLQDLGQKNPAFKSLEKEGREATPGKNGGNLTDQKQLDAMQKAAEKSGETSQALDKLQEDLQKLQKAVANLPNDHSPAADAARQKLAQDLANLSKQAAALGQPMPNLDDAIAALKANKTGDFQRDMDAATTDMEKEKEMVKSLEQMQQQSDKIGRDLPEQLKLGQPDAAQQTLQKMIDKLNAGKLTPDDLNKMLDEVSRSVNPASPYGKAADFLKQATAQMKSGDKSAAAKSLADAANELGKASSELADAKSLQESLDAVNAAEVALATHCPYGERPGNSHGQGRGTGKGPGGGGVGTWTEDDSQLYPEMSGLWDNSHSQRPDQAPRGQTDRGDPQLADNLSPTKLHGQVAPGTPMPAITLKGVSIKGQSSVTYQEAVTTAQSDAQSALNQDQVPRAYQGAVKDYFDDLKK